MTSICNSAMSKVYTFLDYTLYIQHIAYSQYSTVIQEFKKKCVTIVIEILSVRQETRKFVLNDGIQYTWEQANRLKLFLGFSSFSSIGIQAEFGRVVNAGLKRTEDPDYKLLSDHTDLWDPLAWCCK